MSDMYVIGVDPGISGALVLLQVSTMKIVDCIDMPTVIRSVSTRTSKGKDGKPGKTLRTERRSVSAAELREWVAACANNFGRDRLVAVIEDVHAMPRDSAAGAFWFGKSAGIVEGVLSGVGIPYEFVRPEVWKKAIGVSADKKLAIKTAQERFPDSAGLFTLAKHDGRAEAALLASWRGFRARGSL